jgi:hypothetical protein
MLFKRALADSLHKANGTIHSSDSVQVPRLSRFESALAFGLGGRNTHHCHRRPRMHLRHGACYTLNIYDYLLHCSLTGTGDSAYLVSPVSYGRTMQSASKKGDVKVE